VIFATSVWNLLVDAAGTSTTNTLTIGGPMKKNFHTEIAKITKTFEKAGNE
jgi:hypothetical protein